jgi:FMN-dependent NADH-azoreductase
MKKLLHIIATPRGEESRTLKVSRTFLDSFKFSHSDWVVEELDLFDLFGEAKEAWQDIIAHIERFMSADGYLISTPMWNFGIPYRLKHYIDIIVQPRYLFKYTAEGVEGLVKGKKMVVLASRGGEYTTDQMRPMDHQEPYLRAVFGFVGLVDMTFVIAQPMDAGGPELQTQKIEEAQTRAREVAEGF